jgi:Flp pilus assembly secretin CpaC
MERSSLMLLMAAKDKDTVMLRVEVSEVLRNRLKAQSARMGMTMGELVERLVDEPITLKELELEALKKLEQKE